MLRSLQFSARFSRVSYSQSFRSTTKFAAQPIFVRNMSHGESAIRPQPDKVLVDIADYVHNYKVDSELAYETARLCLIDTIGCGLEGLRFKECARLMGPVVEGTIVPNGPLCTSSPVRALTTFRTGTKIPGTNYQLDPIRGAFNIGTMIRWLDYNDCWLAAECA